MPAVPTLRPNPCPGNAPGSGGVGRLLVAQDPQLALTLSLLSLISRAPLREPGVAPSHWLKASAPLHAVRALCLPAQAGLTQGQPVTPCQSGTGGWRGGTNFRAHNQPPPRRQAPHPTMRLLIRQNHDRGLGGENISERRATWMQRLSVKKGSNFHLGVPEKTSLPKVVSVVNSIMCINNNHHLIQEHYMSGDLHTVPLINPIL